MSVCKACKGLGMIRKQGKYHSVSYSCPTCHGTGKELKVCPSCKKEVLEGGHTCRKEPMPEYPAEIVLKEPKRYGCNACKDVGCPECCPESVIPLDLPTPHVSEGKSSDKVTDTSIKTEIAKIIDNIIPCDCGRLGGVCGKCFYKQDVALAVLHYIRSIKEAL